MATYVNNLRLTELATGEGSGTWGTTTNTNLELIGEALGHGSETIANASTHTITVADGTSDSARSFYLICAGGGQACTVTLAPNTLNKVWMIENTTSATLTFTQGSGANVAVPAGHVKMIATNGAGSGAVVYDLLTDVNLAGTTTAVNLDISGDVDIDGTLNVDTLDVDGAVNFSATITMATNTKLQFRDTGIFINSSADGQLDIVADTEIQIAATTIDINGAINASGEIIAASLDISGNIDVDGVTNLDVLDVDGAVDMASTLKVGGTVLATAAAAVNSTSAGGFGFASNNTAFYSFGANTSTAGSYTFQNLSSNASVNVTSLSLSSTGAVFNEGSVDADFRIESNGNTNMLFVDGGNNRVGIGTATPDQALVLSAGGLQITGQIGSPTSGQTGAMIDYSGGGARYWSRGADASTRGTINFYQLENDGGNQINSLSFSTSGVATFASAVISPSFVSTAGGTFTTASGNDLNIVYPDGRSLFFKEAGTTTLTLDNAQGATFAGKIEIGQSTTFPTTGLINHTNTFLYLQGGSAGIILRSASGSAEMMRIQPSAVVVNDDSADIDFRVESNGNAHMLFVDGGNDRVIFGGTAQDASGTMTYTSGTGLLRHTTSAGTAKDHLLYSIAGVNNGFQTTQDTSNNITYKFHTGGNQLAATFGSEVIFNDAGLDRDFRVESNGNANMLFVDGGNNKVGIGTNSPATHLQVEGASGAELGLHRTSGSTTGLLGSITCGNKDIDSGMGGIDFTQDGATNSSRIGFFTQPSGGAKIERFRIHSAGGVEATRGDAGTLITANSSSDNGSGIINYFSSLTSASNNVNCSHFQGTTQGVASYKLLGNGASTWSSDINLKRDVETARDGYLDDVKALRVVKYKWKNDPKSGLELGLIAQEVEAIFPSLVTADKNAIGDEVLYTAEDSIPEGKTTGDVKVEGTTYKGVKYSVLPMIMLKAIQEQQTLIESLTARIAALEE